MDAGPAARSIHFDQLFGIGGVPPAKLLWIRESGRPNFRRVWRWFPSERCVRASGKAHRALATVADPQHVDAVLVRRPNRHRRPPGPGLGLCQRQPK